MSNVYFTWQDLERAGHSIVTQLQRDGWQPQRIVGITRGGLPLAVWLSHALEVPMTSLAVSLRDNSDVALESNAWLSEDAFGYSSDPVRTLIVDDINDSGATFRWIQQDWQSGCLPNDARWANVWGNSTRFATLVENVNSDFTDVSYSWLEISRAEDSSWYVFPWERSAWEDKTT